MPEKCTCGTTLVEEARFCHRCGRPTSQAPANLPPDSGPDNANGTPPPLPATAAPLQAQAAQLPIAFGNPIAVRVSVIMAMSIIMLEMIPGLNFLFLLWWLLAGWAAVLLYRRLTGSVLSVQAGARLGFMTGVFHFIGMTLISALTMMVTGKQVLDTMIKQNPEMQQVVNDPPLLAGVFLVVLILFFCFVVGACAAGGALAARSMARRTGTNI